MCRVWYFAPHNDGYFLNPLHSTGAEKDDHERPKGGRGLVAENGPVFSKFDFSTAERVGSKKKGPQTTLQLLDKVKAQNERLEKLRAKDSDKAESKLQKLKWEKAMARADGEVVKDDPKLLQQALKRQESKKKKTKREWSARVETQQKQIDAKQKQRKANLKARATEKIERRKNRGKKTKASKKPVKRPGFEGGGTKPKTSMTLQGGYRK